MLRILIADSHKLFLNTLAKLIGFTYPTMTIVKVDDTASLAHYLHEQPWDIIICDISLQTDNNLKYFRETKLLNATTHLYLMGMQPDGLILQRIAATGAIGYLPKDKMHEEILPLIQKRLLVQS